MGYSTEKLEALALEKLAREPGNYSDGGGLRLTVRSRKARSWVFNYTLDHTLRSIGLGPYPEVTLAMARERAAEVRHLVEAHRDPHEARAVVRAAVRAKSAKAMTFKQCAEKMHAHRTHWGTAQWFITLSTYAFPMLGNLKVATINTGRVLKVLAPIWASKTKTASRLRGRIENVLDWAKARGYRDGKNPARWRGHLDHFLPAPANVEKVGHHAALPFRQIAKDRYGQMAKGRMAAMELRRKRANARATKLTPIIAELRAAGVTSPHGVAKALNARGVPTVTGKGKWQYIGVRRVLARLQM